MAKPLEQDERISCGKEGDATGRCIARDDKGASKERKESLVTLWRLELIAHFGPDVMERKFNDLDCRECEAFRDQRCAGGKRGTFIAQCMLEIVKGRGVLESGVSSVSVH